MGLAKAFSLLLSLFKFKASLPFACGTVNTRTSFSFNKLATVQYITNNVSATFSEEKSFTNCVVQNMTKCWPFLSVLHIRVCYPYKAGDAVESLGILNYQNFFSPKNLGQTLKQNCLQLGNSFHFPAQFENGRLSKPRCPPSRRNAAENLLL